MAKAQRPRSGIGFCLSRSESDPAACPIRSVITSCVSLKRS